MRPARATRGFTLVEVLVVMALAGVLLGAVALSTAPDDATRVVRAAERLAQVMRYAQFRASVTQRSHGIAIEGRRYRVVAYRDGRWAPSPAAQARSGRLPEGLRFVGYPDVRGAADTPVVVFAPARDEPPATLGVGDVTRPQLRALVRAVSLTELRVVTPAGGGT